MKHAAEFIRGVRVRNDAMQARFALSLHDRDPAGVEPDQVYRDLVQLHLPHPYTLIEGLHVPASLFYLQRANAASHYRYLWGEIITKDLFSQFGVGPARPDHRAKI
jgi:Zn-dependent oligopeptidase